MRKRNIEPVIYGKGNKVAMAETGRAIKPESQSLRI